MVGKKIYKNLFTFNFHLLLFFSFVYIALNSLLLDRSYRQDLAIKRIISENTLGVMAEEPSITDFNPQYLGGEVININAKSAFAIDVDSGAVLYDKNSVESVMPASTVKIITALVALDSYKIDQQLLVGNISADGQKVGLYKGEELSAEDLLYALLLSSANDAAEVLAQNYPGGRDMFIGAMNIKAQNLGLKNSVFLNPSGLDQEGQQTTAQDMVKVSFYAMQNPVFERVVGTKKYTIYGRDGQITRSFYNINQLLGKVEGVKGIKTGKTDGAMENLLTYVDRENAKVIIGLFGSSDRFGETEKLIDWIFVNYKFL